MLTVDSNNNLTKITYPGSYYYSFGYTESSLLTDEYDPKGNHFIHQFDAGGQVIQVRNPEGGQWTYSSTVNTAGDIQATVQTGENNIIQYDDHTDLTGVYTTKITDPSGFITNITRSADNLTETNIACGMKWTTKYELDPIYQYKYVSSSAAMSPAGIIRTITDTKAYKDTDSDKILDRITETVGVNGKNWKTVNSTLNGSITQTSPLGRIITLNYDTSSLLTQQKTVAGLLPVTYGYDARGRFTTAAVGDRTATIFYDNQGNVEYLTTPDSKTYYFTYDEMGRPLTSTMPDNTVIQYAYDKNGNMTLLTNPKNASFGFDYTGINQRKSMTTPLSGSYQYSYDKEKKLKLLQFPSGRQIQLNYAQGQLANTVTPEGTTTYTYSCSNLLGSATRGTEQIVYGYDGTLLKTDTRTGLLNQAISYTYNNLFKTASITYAGITQALTYDNDGLLINAGGITITRNAQNGLPEQLSDGTMTAVRNFSGYGELDGLSHSIGGNMPYGWTLTRDLAGRITKRVENISGGTVTWDYTYDDNGRLATVKRDGMLLETYTYDGDGNRLTDGSRTYTYSAEDHLITAGAVSYQFDVDGFLTSKTNGSNITSYQYSSRGELLRVTKADGMLITYDHDPMGRRIAKRVNGVITEKYLWKDAITLLSVYDGNDNLLMRFNYADGHMPVSMTQNGIAHYLMYDQVGSLRAVSNTSGSIIKQIDYDSFGNMLNDTNPAFKVPFGFAGGLHDRDTGLVRFGARDYDPAVGRWTAKDPMDFRGGDINLFGYVSLNPVKWTDPNGLGGVIRSNNPLDKCPSGTNCMDPGDTSVTSGELYRDPYNPGLTRISEQMLLPPEIIGDAVKNVREKAKAKADACSKSKASADSGPQIGVPIGDGARYVDPAVMFE